MTVIPRPYILMWTVVGLFLTIAANFIPVYITNPPWLWFGSEIKIDPVGFKSQVGAVLLVSCLGGRTAGILTQFAYLIIGLVGVKIFNDGGGIEYLQKPAFGYLLAFLPGAWVCGKLAFKRTLQVENLGFSCLCGLVTIHSFGIIYLVGFKLINCQQTGEFKLLESVMNYSVYPFTSQAILACAASTIAYILRRVMFY